MSGFLTHRYDDVYQFAQGTIKLGCIIQKLSVFIATFALFGGLASTGYGLSGHDSSDLAYISGVVGFAVAVVGFVGFIGGVIVVSQSNIMQTVLDIAVNTSAAASIEEKASILHPATEPQMRRGEANQDEKS